MPYSSAVKVDAGVDTESSAIAHESTIIGAGRARCRSECALGTATDTNTATCMHTSSNAKASV